LPFALKLWQIEGNIFWKLKFYYLMRQTKVLINMIKIAIIFLLQFSAILLLAQEASRAELSVHANEGKYKISKHIYGHFSEHLGRCIYGGIWVGVESVVPNINGYRKDVLDALRHLNIPNLRWPGGCFADEYHWKDGIGPKENRPEMINTHWGGVVEDNSFGTHEFLDFCELLGTEPVICGNVGSGTVEEMADWVEYINFDGKSPLAEQRRKNGREASWGLKYWGVGNENWGCGGNMEPEYYANEYRRYATYARNYGENKLFKIAGGANSWDYNWTEVLMKNIPLRMMDGISLHYYTVPHTWQNKGSATDFDEDDYFITLKKAADMDKLIRRHTTIMDKYDPNKRVALVVDEWGNWFDVEPGTNPGFLYQQNTLRDALTAALTLNIFNNHAHRVRMANIAQTVNVLQAVILTNETSMVRTPTYHVFDLYQPHKEATLIPYALKCADYEQDDQSIPTLTVSCSKSEDGKLNITLVNVDPTEPIDLNATIYGFEANKITGKIITAATIRDHNTFEDANRVEIKPFDECNISDDDVVAKIPSKSIVLLQLTE
jgi:alpha-N-arabinofuranosidase